MLGLGFVQLWHFYVELIKHIYDLPKDKAYLWVVAAFRMIIWGLRYMLIALVLVLWFFSLCSFHIDDSDDDDDDDDEDDTEALLAELEQIKKERADEKLRKVSFIL